MSQKKIQILHDLGIYAINEIPDDFKLSVKEIRRLGDIPDSGFKDVSKMKRWHEKIDPLTAEDFYDAIQLLQRKNKLSQNFYEILEQYIYFGDSYLSKIKNKKSLCELAEFDLMDRVTGSTDISWGTSEVNFAKIFISKEASITEVKHWLDKNWSQIKDSMGEKKRFRKSTKLERNERIKELHSKTFEELGIKRMGTFSKETYIQQIIKKEFGEEVDVENIRNIKYK